MRYWLLIVLMGFHLIVHAFTLRPDAPSRYVIRSNDTLWSIAGRYLTSPWEWQAFWRQAGIKNPLKLYPGTVLYLRYKNHTPYLHAIFNGIVKLSPKIRPVPMLSPVPPISLHVIQPFLNASLVMDDERLKIAPYIVSFAGEHLLGGQGNDAYVTSLCPPHRFKSGADVNYAIYRMGRVYWDVTGKFRLGRQARLMGYADIIQPGKPGVIRIVEVTSGIRRGDRILLNDFPTYPLYFEPKAPGQAIEGRIIDILPDSPDAYTQGAAGLVVLIDHGDDNKLAPGDVLAISEGAHCVPDPFNRCHCVHIPRERVGELMIFRVFSQTSLALVVRSTRAIHINNVVTEP